MREEVADLRERPVNAQGLDDLGRLAGGLKALDEFLRQVGAAHLGEALDLLQRQHRHDARHDGHRDAARAAFFHEAVIHGVVEEELCGDERRTRADLAFQIVQVGLE